MATANNILYLLIIIIIMQFLTHHESFSFNDEIAGALLTS